MLDAPEDVFKVALIYLGRDPNSEESRRCSRPPKSCG